MITVRRHTQLAAAPELIFERFVSPSRFPAFYERAARWERLSGAEMAQGSRYAVLMHAGAVFVRSVVELTRVEKARCLTWRSVSGVHQQGSVELRSKPCGTDVAISVTLTLGPPLVGRVAERYVARILAPRMDAALLALRCGVELGDRRA